jgi:hypothetical protein
VKPGADLDGLDLLCVLNATSCGGNYMDGHPYLFWRSGHYKSMRYFDWKMQISDAPRKVWLYDLSTDFAEKLNIAEGISVDVLRMWTANGCFEDHRNDTSMALSQAQYAHFHHHKYAVSAPPASERTYDTEEEGESFDEWIVSTKSKIDTVGHVDVESPMLLKLQLSCNILQILDRVDQDQVC